MANGRWLRKANKQGQEMMEFLRSMPFRPTFYVVLAIAACLFVFGTLFQKTDSGFLVSMHFSIKGTNLLFGANAPGHSSRQLVNAQPSIWLVLIGALASLLLTFIKRIRSYRWIAMMGIASVLALILLPNGIRGFEATTNLYVLIALAGFSTVHAWAHHVGSAKSPA